MVIQRIQTLWLLISAALMVNVSILPYAEAGATKLYAYDNWPMAIISLLIIVLLCISIFSYKNLRLQKQITVIAFLFAIIFAAIAYIANANTEDVTYSIVSIICLTLSGILDIFAYRAMSKDQKRLRNADRLWS